MINDSLPAIVITVLILSYLVVGGVVFAIYRYTRGSGEGTPAGSVAKAAIAGIIVSLLFIIGLTWANWPSQVKAVSVTEETPLDDAQLLGMGKNLFNVHCAICHGSDGKAPGGKGADLTHRISFESALLNIRRGANNFKRDFPGSMPPMVSDENRAAQIAHYVSSGFTENEEGKMLYGMIQCARCHGDDGRGIRRLGPNIREFDERTILMVLRNGKNGVIGTMPKFDHFSDIQQRSLARYVLTFQK
jgi:cbb3-type cytochrome c oxidase subunit III